METNTIIKTIHSTHKNKKIKIIREIPDAIYKMRERLPEKKNH